MAEWKEPKSNYIATDEVKPEIFNTLAENEKYLKETQDTKITTTDVQNAVIPITQATSRTNLGTNESVKSVFGKIKKWFADLRALAFKDKVVESDIDGQISGTKISDSVSLADNATKLANARNIGLSGVTATAQSFNGSSAITIPITAIPGTLLTGSTTISTSGNAATSTKLANAKTIGLSGVTATAVSFDGSSNVSIVISNIPASLLSGTGAISITGNAATATNATNASQATKLTNSRTIGLSGVTATAQSFNGTANITIPISAIPTTILTGNLDATRVNGLAQVAKSGSYNDLTDKPATGKQTIWSSETATISVPLNKNNFVVGATYEFLCRKSGDEYVFYQKYLGNRFMGLNNNNTGYMTDGVVTEYYLAIDMYTSDIYMYGGYIYTEGDYREYRQNNYPCYKVSKLL